MKNKTKALLIPLAAFAVTVTGASAFNSDVLMKAGLTEEQISAFEEAHELRKDGDKEGARNLIAEAGIDIDTLSSVREAMHEHKKEMHTAIDEAVEAGNYEAFLVAIEGSPLADIITSEEDFNLFVEAHELRESGDKEAAHEIMEDLGFEPKMHGMMHGRGHGMHSEIEGERDGRFNGFHGGHDEDSE